MKFLSVFALVLCLAAACAAASYGGGAAAAGGYGAGSIPAPPCPKNYLFSCQPNVAQAPCAQAAGGYGGAGSYSQQYPTYSFPQYFNNYQTKTKQDEN